MLPSREFNKKSPVLEVGLSSNSIVKCAPGTGETKKGSKRESVICTAVVLKVNDHLTTRYCTFSGK